MDADARVWILVERGKLVGTGPPGESSGHEHRPRRVVLARPGVVHTIIPVVQEPPAIRLEIVDAHLEVVVLVDEQQSVVPDRRKVPAQNGLRSTERVAVTLPPRPGVDEA